MAELAPVLRRIDQDFDASVAAARAILAAERLRRKRQPGLTEFVEQFRTVSRR